MTVNKGLLSLVENTPNFSNQALENAVDTLKVGWVIKSSHLDSLTYTTILTASQKNRPKGRHKQFVTSKLGQGVRRSNQTQCNHN